MNAWSRVRSFYSVYRDISIRKNGDNHLHAPYAGEDTGAAEGPLRIWRRLHLSMTTRRTQ